MVILTEIIQTLQSKILISSLQNYTQSYSILEEMQSRNAQNYQICGSSVYLSVYSLHHIQVTPGSCSKMTSTSSYPLSPPHPPLTVVHPPSKIRDVKKKKSKCQSICLSGSALMQNYLLQLLQVIITVIYL